MLYNDGEDMKYLLFIFFVGSGLFARIKPYEYWKFQNYFNVKNGEPTDYAISSIKYGGVCSIILGFILLVFM